MTAGNKRGDQIGPRGLLKYRRGSARTFSISYTSLTAKPPHRAHADREKWLPPPPPALRGSRLTALPIVKNHPHPAPRPAISYTPLTPPHPSNSPFSPRRGGQIVKKIRFRRAENCSENRRFGFDFVRPILIFRHVKKGADRGENNRGQKKKKVKRV